MARAERWRPHRRVGGSGAVRPYRRGAFGLGLVLVAGSLAADPRTAAAHSCAVPVTVPQGEETQVQVGVTVGEAAIRDITFEFADSIEVTEVVERRGWDVEAQGTVIRFSGGRLDAGACDVFAVVVRAKAAGTFRVRAFQHLEGGQVVEHPPDGDIFIDAAGESVVVNHQGPPDPAFEQVMYVTAQDDDGSGPRTALLIVTAGATLGALALLLPRRRSS